MVIELRRHRKCSCHQWGRAECSFSHNLSNYILIVLFLFIQSALIVLKRMTIYAIVEQVIIRADLIISFLSGGSCDEGEINRNFLSAGLCNYYIVGLSRCRHFDCICACSLFHSMRTFILVTVRKKNDMMAKKVSD